MSTISILSVITTYIIVYIETIIRHLDNNTNEKGLTFFTSVVGFGYGMGACFAPYSLHPVIPNMRDGMKEPRKFLKIMFIVWCVILTCQVSVGLCGYFTYGKDVQASVTSNFSTYFAYIASILLMLKSCSVPALFLYPIVLIYLKWIQVRRYKKKIKNRMENKNNKSMILNKTSNDNYDGNNNNNINKSQDKPARDEKDDNKGTRFKEIMFRTVLVLVALGAAILVPDFSLMANLLGALCASSLSVLFPATMYIAFIRDQRKKGKAYALQSKETVKCVLCVFVVVCSTTICLWNCTSVALLYS